ncbi:MAG TPA: TIGR03557 family F420-dependent LLM class oxidoreductase [Acidimicrobiia bacterium]|nr:TIGR03557 family F420-dependent LLM class oxidoreductase [Acidimicrobiia bacterium]
MVSTDALVGDGLELGYWLSSEEHAPAALIEHAAAAERAGIRTAMISDHYAPWTERQGQSAFVWTMLGALAQATSDLRIGTGVTAAVHRMHPLVIAHAAATTEVLMPGRFFLGLGTGERLNEDVMGQRWPRPAERRAMLEEAVDLVRALWDGETVTRTDGHFRVERARLYTRPAVPPPIVVSASGRRSAQLAGRRGDAVLSAKPDSDVVDAFEAAGGDGKPRLVQLHVCWAEDHEAARRTVRQWWPNGGIPGAVLGELARPAEFDQLVQALSDEAIQHAVVTGPDPDRYVDAVTRAVAAGYTTVYLHQIGPDQRGFLDFVRRELRPRLSG